MATFPTGCEGFRGHEYIVVNYWKDWVGYIHYGCATCMFLCFVIFCCFIFQEKDDGTAVAKDDTMKLRRNFIYKCCGIGILVSISIIGGIALLEYFIKSLHFNPFTTIVFETTSLWCFGFSWLLKGSQNWKKSKHSFLRVIIKQLR